ncbi:hypothetical protein [Clostridium manihotivorum]|nr:hypothetical protein [Clostridium manihotivorum]
MKKKLVASISLNNVESDFQSITITQVKKEFEEDMKERQFRPAQI